MLYQLSHSRKLARILTITGTLVKCLNHAYFAADVIQMVTPAGFEPAVFTLRG